VSISGEFLPHRVSIIRHGSILDEDGDPVLDDYGQPTTEDVTVATGVAAGIQPKSAREVASVVQAGASISDHRIYMHPRDVTTADVIVHDPDACPMRTDLPDARYSVVGVPDAAGAGHHLEIAAKLVGSPQSAYAVPVGVEGS